MLIKPAPGDKDDRTGLKNRKRDTGKLAQSAVGRIESINARQASNIHLDHTLPDLRVLTALLMHLPGMAYRCRYDEDRTMEFVSEGCFHLTGYRSAELILNQKVSYWQLIHHEDREPVRQNVDLSLKRQNAYDLIYCIVTKTGEKKWVRDQGRGVFMQDGDPLALEGFISDITDKKWS